MFMASLRINAIDSKRMGLRLVKTFLKMLFLRISKSVITIVVCPVMTMNFVITLPKWPWIHKASGSANYFHNGMTKFVAGLEIATHWSPMRPKIECWRLSFQNWSPAGDSRFVR